MDMKKSCKIFAASIFLAAVIAGVLTAGNIPGLLDVVTSTVHAEGESGRVLPLPPLHPYVYATGKTWAMLAWDAPDGSDPRSADGYKIYQDDAKTSLNGGEKIDAAYGYYLVTNLTPDTTYQFHFAGVRGDIEGEKSAAVQAATLPDGFTLTGPQDQFKKEGETAEFEVEVQGIDATKDIVTYTWQQYDAAGIYQGQWNNIETWGEQTNVLKRTIHADNRGELNGKHYRVKADIQKGGTHSAITTLYSRAATLHVIDNDGKGRAAVGLTAVYEDGTPLPEYNGEYYINPGEKVTLTATAIKPDDSPVDSGAIDIGYQMNQVFDRIYKLNEGEEGPDKNGQVTATLQTGPGTDADEGICRLATEYRTGDPDDPRAYSAPVIIHMGENLAGESYQIDYQLNGGVNGPGNPLALPKDTRGVTLTDASRDYASFTGWYTDSATGAESRIENAELTRELLNSQADENGVVTLYAGWQDYEYLVTYDLGDCEPADTLAKAVNDPDNPDTYTMNESILLKAPVRPGYTFLGWYKEPERTNRVDHLPPYDASDGESFIPPEPPEAVTLYAKWQLEAYTITYILDGGTNNPANPASYTVESPDIILAAPSKEGAVFAGWYRNTLTVDGTNEQLDTITRGSTGDLTLYARWDAENKKSLLEKDNDGKGGNSGYLPVKKTTGGVKTGDTANSLIWVCLMLASGAGITIGVRKKKHSNRE
ncbi:InlB B-repeat-containing protein [Qiania dongpingensis]|uniref:InlB B-repeat-containing protein n=1 Tax=Qiania dongpingensis TaxID=2763669 RepID=A0A7G9G4Q3_9FIRM|nr:InlB B-repeat-containing protein [Qiania dongpingensis]QNM05785.1 InlB B-repeat-containing protein [Qiania dongpingensis]